MAFSVQASPLLHDRPQVKDLCGLLLEYIQGRLADDTVAQRLSALFPERKQEQQGAA
jgi:hypothetical protein